MNYTKELLELLKLRPNEEFQIKSPTENAKYTYRITSTGYLQYLEESGTCYERWENDHTDTLNEILNGVATICKHVKTYTESDKIVLKYVKLCGMRYLAMDEDGTIFAFLKEPIKNTYGWYADEAIEINAPVSFISWDDDVPFDLESIIFK